MSFGIGERRILAIDWDAWQVRFVHAALRKGDVRIQRLFAVDLPKEVDLADPETLGGLLRQTLAQERVRTDRVILDVPRDQALLTPLSLPAASPNEMPALVEFQIAKEIPFPLSEAVVDFAMPAPSDQPRVDVLVGTVRREVVGYYERACAAAGLKLERLGLRPYANKVALNEFVGAGRHDCVALVDVGPRLTEIDVVVEGRLAFSRAASVAVPRPAGPGGEPAPTDSSVGAAEDSDGSAIIRFPARPSAEVGEEDRVVSALLVEVIRSLEAFRATSGGKEVGHIVVAGACGVEARLAEAIGRRFGASVELYNPARRFGWPEERGREARGFSAALGLVSGHATEGRLHFDFLHPKKTVTATERRLRKAPAVAAAAVVLIAATVAVYWFGIAPKKAQLGRIEKQIDELGQRIKELKKIDEKVIAEADRFEKEQIVWLDELDRLCDELPGSEDMVLGRIDMYFKGSRINLPFEATSARVADETVARINAMRAGDRKQFDAKLTGTRTVGSGQYPASGTIDVEVVGRPAAKPAAAARSENRES